MDSSTYIARLTPAGSTLYFTAAVGPGAAHGLWKSDGTPVGTTLVKSFDPHWYIAEITAVGSRVFFRLDKQGGTFEAPSPTWEAPRLPLGSLRWLLERGAALTDLRAVQVTGRWTGSRLSGLRVGRDDAGVWHLSGLSSKGFLLGPLHARRLAEQVRSGGTPTSPLQ